jgi:hypothetical protein
MDMGNHQEEAPMTAEERTLKEALWALNRARPLDIDMDDPQACRRAETILEVRDRVWQLGVDLYGWEG